MKVFSQGKEWKQEGVMARLACEDIQSYVSGKLERGSQAQQDLLKAASCLGNELDQSLLAAAVSTNDCSSATLVLERLAEAATLYYLVSPSGVLLMIRYNMPHMT